MTVDRPGGSFQKGSALAREAGRKGGLALAAKNRRYDKPYTGSILDVMDAADLTGPTWAQWRVFLKAVFAIEMDEAELAMYSAQTERDEPPESPVGEAWMAIGRRGGKSRIAALLALFLAIRFDASNLAPGEKAIVPVIAADRRQARQVLGYLKGLLELDHFRGYVHRTLKESVELHCGVDVSVFTASYRSTRGFTCIAVVCDEVAFWYNDSSSANPDTEVLQALRPSMATVADSLLLGLSSPYAAKGELYRAVERSFGKDDPRVLVWNADTRTMNPAVPAHIVENAFEDDPVSAASEYGQDGRVQFRRDVEAFIDPEAIRAVTAEGRRELPRQHGVTYSAFADPSGGSQDSFTIAIAHSEDGLAVLDAVREVRPPFSPDDVVADFAALLNSYGLSTVTGDRYGGIWPRDRFSVHGIEYKASELTKSDIYREIVAPINGGRVVLLDLTVLVSQFIGLERRVARGGRDSVDHAPGGRDDVANAAAGALVAVLGPRETATLFPYLSTSYISPGDGSAIALDTPGARARHWNSGW